MSVAAASHYTLPGQSKRWACRNTQMLQYVPEDSRVGWAQRSLNESIHHFCLCLHSDNAAYVFNVYACFHSLLNGRRDTGHTTQGNNLVITFWSRNIPLFVDISPFELVVHNPQTKSINPPRLERSCNQLFFIWNIRQITENGLYRRTCRNYHDNWILT